MLGADERGVRRTCGYAAATSKEGNNADGKNHKPVRGGAVGVHPFGKLRPRMPCIPVAGSPWNTLRAAQKERRKGPGACLQCRRGRTPYGGGCIPKTQPPQARKRDAPHKNVGEPAGPPVRGGRNASGCGAGNWKGRGGEAAPQRGQDFRQARRKRSGAQGPTLSPAAEGVPEKGRGLRRKVFRLPCLALAPCTCFSRGRLAGVRPNHGFSLAHREETATTHALGNNAMPRPIGSPGGKLGAAIP